MCQARRWGVRSGVQGQQTAMPLEDLIAQEGQLDPSQVGGESKTQHPNSKAAQSGGQACPTNIFPFQQSAKLKVVCVAPRVW